MTTKVEKKFPRSKVIERQNEKAREVVELDENTLEGVRGGSARYGLPPPIEISLES
ncbi:hypothetical protein ATI61_12235 [Archangium gephyra]|uniref:Uncharacterized protein n=1 Tax=Archangium gephyra TaxID=48 RepID=A0AAC8Q058_9BACT|nr:hypothetical protein [Archangium gephyra]AKI98567.1 Hypothetical protein AA314_00194 [Archangium gephyra]REG20335.1 hypothetical protein ATI61_12235 [Archangium gephyra]